MKKLLGGLFAAALLGFVTVAHAEKGDDQGSNGGGSGAQVLPAPGVGWLSLSALLISAGAIGLVARRRSRRED